MDVVDNDGFVNFLKHGPLALPDDLAVLLGYLASIDLLLRENANMNELTWPLVEQTANETELLLGLQDQIIVKAGLIPARTADAILAKFQIWEAISISLGDEMPDAASSALTKSIHADLESLAREERAALAPVPSHFARQPAENVPTDTSR